MILIDLELDTDDLSGEGQVPPMKKLEDLIHLAELCVDLLQQNEEHYAEVKSFFLFLRQFFGFTAYKSDDNVIITSKYY